ncbi:pentapeptide repeat-containing protein [Rhodocaloribacter sp.]
MTSSSTSSTWGEKILEWAKKISVRVKGAMASKLTRFLIGVVIVLSIMVAVVAIPKYQVARDLDAGFIRTEQIPAQVNEYRKTVIQIIGGLVVAVGLWLTWRRIVATEKTVVVSEEGQITERFTRAIEQLGSDRMAIRLGGIYALERIAKDSPKDYWTVMEVLSAFVREHARIEDNAEAEQSGKTVPTDIQAVLTVIGRRKGEDKGNIDLHGTDLSGAILEGAHLEGVDLQGAHLKGAYLEGAHLEDANLVGGVRLDGAHLDGAHLEDARLEMAHLPGAFLQKANFKEAKLAGADLRGALVKGANFEGADLQGCKNLTAMMLCLTLSLKETKLDDSLKAEVRRLCPHLLKEEPPSTPTPTPPAP